MVLILGSLGVYADSSDKFVKDLVVDEFGSLGLDLILATAILHHKDK